ncbi:alpha/beta hydrolase [Modestobacter roseus]|uniref:alpha/beta hydrolase n=1 Tax=Modestobacter roseus TaxID=1181884 RepID=UPI0034E02545
MSAPPLAQLAGWDVPQLRGCVGTLALVADRLTPWRVRLDALGRRLDSAECWSGEAGTAAAGALLELSGVATGVGSRVDAALGALRRLVDAATDAAEHAARALAVADSAGLQLDDAGRVTGLPPQPHPAMAPDQAAELAARRTAAEAAAALATGLAAEARAAGARALVAAVSAGEELGDLAPAAGPVTFADLLPRLDPAGRHVVPPDPRAGPVAVADWWAALSAPQQLDVIVEHPDAVGALDGLPGWARDRANRLRLQAALAELPPGEARETATAVAGQLAAGGDRPVQLLLFDPGQGLAALSVGDLDAAEAIAVLVPGILTTVADDLAGLTGDAADVVAAATAAAPGLAVAAVAWLGYRTPGLLGALQPVTAVHAGRVLDRALDGLAAARGVPGVTPAARTTVVGHSYGSLVTGQAARAPGRLAADAVVLLGSPGTGAGRASRLEAGEVYGAWTAADPISTSGYYGPSPADLGFGDVPLPTDPGQGHTEYYDPDRPTLAAIGAVVAGVGPVR